MNENSLKAYQSLIDKKLLGKRESEVYRAILENPNKTDLELTSILYMTLNDMPREDPNYVRPRRRKLERLGLIKEFCVRTCTISHEKASTWVKKDFRIEEIERLKHKLKDSKYWIDKIKEQEEKRLFFEKKYWECKRKEQKQLSLKEFSKR